MDTGKRTSHTLRAFITIGGLAQVASSTSETTSRLNGAWSQSAAGQSHKRTVMVSDTTNNAKFIIRVSSAVGLDVLSTKSTNRMVLSRYDGAAVTVRGVAEPASSSTSEGGISERSEVVAQPHGLELLRDHAPQQHRRDPRVRAAAEPCEAEHRLEPLGAGEDHRQPRDHERADQEPDLAAGAAQAHPRVPPPPRAEQLALARLARGEQAERAGAGRVGGQREADVLVGGRRVAARERDV